MVYHFQYILLNFFLIPSALQDINKRLSLPADIRLPEGYLEKFAMNSPPFDKPMSRRLRRASLVSVCVCVRACVHVCSAETSLVLFSLVEPVTTDRDGLLVVRVCVSLSGNSSGICCVSVTFNCVSVVHLGCDIHVCIRTWAAGMLAVWLTCYEQLIILN